MNRDTAVYVIGFVGLILVFVFISLAFTGTSISTILSKVGPQPTP